MTDVEMITCAGLSDCFLGNKDIILWYDGEINSD